MVNARTLPDSVTPVAETIRSLPAWPDESLWDLARAMGKELARRHAPQAVALPVIEVTYSLLGTSPIGDTL